MPLYHGTDNILGSKHPYGFIFIPVTNCVNLNPHTSISVTMKTLSPTLLNLISKEFGSNTHTKTLSFLKTMVVFYVEFRDCWNFYGFKPNQRSKLFLGCYHTERSIC